MPLPWPSAALTDAVQPGLAAAGKTSSEVEQAAKGHGEEELLLVLLWALQAAAGPLVAASCAEGKQIARSGKA